MGISKTDAQCIDQYTATNGLSFHSVGIGQSFIAPCSGYLTDFKINYALASQFPYDVSARVFLGDVNPITSTPIYSQTMNIFVPAPGYFNIHLDIPVPLIGGVPYTFYLRPTSSSGSVASDVYAGGASSGATYNNGAAWVGIISGGGSVSLRNQGLDINFIAVIAAPCTPTTSTTNESICASALPYSWNGLTFTTAGSQTANLTNAAGCDSAATLNLSLKTSPAIGTSSGAGSICSIGGIRNVYNSNTSGGGVWSSSNTSVATVSTNSGATGNVTAVANGVATIKYTKTGVNGCTSADSLSINVAAIETPNAITGTSTVCKGATTTFSSTTPDGVWSSLNVYATVNAGTGVVTGANAGGAVIRYTVSNGGCSASATKNITVNAIPGIPTIGYAAGSINPQYGTGGGFCNNKSFTLEGTPGGGTWSSTGGMTINSASGAASTVSLGAASVTYTVTTNGCSNSRSIGGNVVACAFRGVMASSELIVSSKEFTIYPNPARMFIRISVENLVGKGSIVVTNLYGKQVATQALSMGTNTVDVSKLAKGIYFVGIITSEGKTTKKLVVE